MSRIDVVKTKVFKFDELSDDAKQTALEKLYDINVDDDFWFECCIDDVGYEFVRSLKYSFIKGF